MRTIFFLFFISSFITSSFAQEGGKNRLDFSVSYGLGIPVGSFHKIAPEKSIINTPPSYYINGFDKEGNGAAKIGQFFSGNIRYSFNDHWLFMAEGYRSVNAVNTGPVLNYVNTIFEPDITSVSNNDYRVSAIALGVGYQFHYNKLSFSFAPLVGHAWIAPPDYNFEWFIPIRYEVQKLNNSLLLGLKSNVNYQLNRRFYIGAKIDYNSADFDYEVKLRSPGSNPSSRTDRINYRLLRTGIQFGVRI